MLNPKKLTAFIFLAYVLLTASCGRRGCADKDAENYEPKAKRSCSCCFYYGKIRVVYDYNYYSARLDDKISSIRVYVDGKLRKETTKNLFSLYGKYHPDKYAYFVSSNEDVIVVEQNLGSEKRLTASVVVTGNDGSVLWANNVVFKANTLVTLTLQ